MQMARELAPKIGHSWTIRVMGFFVMFNCAVILAIAKPKKLEKPTSAPWFDLESWKDSTYVLFAVGIFFVGWGLNFASFFVSYPLSLFPPWFETPPNRMARSPPTAPNSSASPPPSPSSCSSS